MLNIQGITRVDPLSFKRYAPLKRQKKIVIPSYSVGTGGILGSDKMSPLRTRKVPYVQTRVENQRSLKDRIALASGKSSVAMLQQRILRFGFSKEYAEGLLFEAIQKEDLDLLHYLLSRNTVNPKTAIDKDEHTPIAFAIHCRNANVLRALLENGAILDSKDFLIAVSEGYDDIVAYLLTRKDLNINACDEDGNTALHKACAKGI